MTHRLPQDAAHGPDLQSSGVRVDARQARAAVDAAGSGGIDPSPREDAPLDDRRRQLAELLVIMGEAVRADGGALRLVDACYDTGVVTVQLSGACSACAVASVTLEAGIERILRQRLDWVTEIHHSVADSHDVAADAALGRGGFVPRAI